MSDQFSTGSPIRSGGPNFLGPTCAPFIISSNPNDKAFTVRDVTLPPGALMVEADSTRLAQVVLNLLTNAAKYTDEGGKIWVVVERQGDEALVRVRDTGIGIPQEMLPRVFDLFVQSEDGRDRDEGGLGIGLALARKISEMHGGTVQAESAGKHRGSEFTITLPLEQPAAARLQIVS